MSSTSADSTGTASRDLFFVGGAEVAFRVHRARRSGEDTVEVATTTGEWNTTPGGRASLGSLGVVIDDLVGYAVILNRPEGHWATSQEIHVESVAAVPTNGTLLTGRGSVVRRDEHSGLARGELVDEHGALIALVTQRLRFIPGNPGEMGDDVGPPSGFTPSPGDVMSQLGATAEETDDGARLTVPLGPTVRNPMGTLHGGILLCASELAGSTALTRGRDDTSSVTSSVKINYLRPGPVSGEVTFEARRVQHGRSVGVAEVVSLTPEGKPCTRATVTTHIP